MTKEAGESTRLVDNQRRARLRGLVEMHAHEVDEIVARLRTAHAADRIDTAMATLLDRGTRYQFASGFERAMLTELGVNARVSHTADTEHQRVHTAGEIQDRRERGMACQWCHDSGWFIPDDDEGQAPTAVRCTHDHEPPRPPAPPEATHYEPRTDPATAYEAMAAARRALQPQADTCRHGVPLHVVCRRCQFAQPT